MHTHVGQAEAKLETADEMQVESRFGPVTVRLSQSVHFAKGMLGMPDKHRYCLAELPGAAGSPKMEKFKLLQSLEDHTLSFIVLPVDNENTLIDAADVDSACKDLDIDKENLVLLFVVSVNRTPVESVVSVNARAPIFIDTGKKKAEQHVLSNSKYLIQHRIN